ncbi:GNAT family N-acetyltransferase [Egicoccus sp. AB-alg2]|uniref:GNAT family N-acetyltransferase n=1 Tax=Egicoccus sp. AB-alg2 TaxID=3242693 RepID=UPI00359D3514
MLRLRAVADLAAYAAVARPFLVAQGEAVHSLALGVLSRVEAGEYADARFWVVEDDEDGAVAGVVQRTPPRPWLVALSPAQDPRDLADAIAVTFAGEGLPRDLVGEAALTEGLARELAACAGVGAEQVMCLPVLACERVEAAPSPPAGRVRAARPEDLTVLVRFAVAFQQEAMPRAELDVDALREGLVRRLAGRHGLWVFERPDGTVVSMAEADAETPDGQRVSAVYTPPAHRGRGYAGATVTAVTRDVLRRRRFAFLNTDAANPTSNALYERLGYRVVGEQAHWRLAV